MLRKNRRMPVLPQTTSQQSSLNATRLGRRIEVNRPLAQWGGHCILRRPLHGRPNATKCGLFILLVASLPLASSPPRLPPRILLPFGLVSLSLFRTHSFNISLKSQHL